MSNIQKLKSGTKTNGIEIEATLTNGVDLSASTCTNVLKLTTSSGATASALTNDTIGTTAEDGFISIDVGGTTVKIPYWLDDV